MRYEKISNQLFVKNRKKLTNQLKEKAIAIVWSADQLPRNGDQFYPYRQSSDFFYLTGIEQEKSVLVLFPDHLDSKFKEILFIIEPNQQLLTWEGYKLDKFEAQAISGIENVKWINSFDAVLHELIIYSENIYLNINEYSKFRSEVISKDIRFINELKSKYPLHNFHRLAPLLTNIRTIKEPEEIAIIKKACEITGKAFLRVMRTVRDQMFEFEIEAEITYEFIKNGASGHAYNPIVASGKNACVLHYNANNKPCLNNDLLLLDFGAEYANYAADLSRTIPVNGKFSDRQRQVYQSVLKVQKEAFKLLKPGITINILNEQVNRIMQNELVVLGLLSEDEIKNSKPEKSLVSNFYPHGTSHFLGIDVHDVGDKNLELQSGMILTVEPGIYIPKECIGIRLENDVLITNGEPIDLMSDIPIEIEEIEAIMLNR